MGIKIKNTLKIVVIVSIIMGCLLAVELFAVTEGNKLHGYELANMLADYAVDMVNSASDDETVQQVVERINVYEGMRLYIADTEGRVIIGSYDSASIGTALGSYGIRVAGINENYDRQMILKVSGEKSYCSIKESNGLVFFSSVSYSYANRRVGTAVLYFAICFLVIDIITVLIIRSITVKLYREEEKSNKDRMTELFNRRAYEAFLAANPGVPKEKDFVYITMDLNELKNVNDTMGHEVGDSMIKGAAEIIKRCFGNYGRVFRVGGDEFVAAIYADDAKLEEIRKDFDDSVNNWAGKRTVRLSISIGCASINEFPDKTVHELAKLADDRMYRDKEQYYRTRGVDRRSQKAALDAICASYNKILRVNLTTDEFEIISMNPNDKSPERGYANTLSAWTKNFSEIGIHPDDREEYVKKMDMDLLRNHFMSGEKNYCIFYRRLNTEQQYRQTRLEILPTGNYSNENQSMYLYVKDIDK